MCGIDSASRFELDYDAVRDHEICFEQAHNSAAEDDLEWDFSRDDRTCVGERYVGGTSIHRFDVAEPQLVVDVMKDADDPFGQRTVDEIWHEAVPEEGGAK